MSHGTIILIVVLSHPMRAEALRRRPPAVATRTPSSFLGEKGTSLQEEKKIHFLIVVSFFSFLGWARAEALHAKAPALRIALCN